MAFTLKQARQLADLTQKEAAEALNISKGTLANYEKYRTKPDIEMSKRIANLYKRTIDELIFFAN